MPPRRGHYVLSLLLVLSSQWTRAENNDDSRISIYTYNSLFASQRKCAVGCWLFYDRDNIGYMFGCEGNPPKNRCFCRQDLQSIATTYLSTCVKASCAYTADIASALSFYSEYCGANTPKETPPSLPTSVPAETTLAPSSPAGQTSPPTRVFYSTVVNTQVETQLIRITASNNPPSSTATLTLGECGPTFIYYIVSCGPHYSFEFLD